MLPICRRKHGSATRPGGKDGGTLCRAHLQSREHVLSQDSQPAPLTPPIPTHPAYSQPDILLLVCLWRLDKKLPSRVVFLAFLEKEVQCVPWSPPLGLPLPSRPVWSQSGSARPPRPAPAPGACVFKPPFPGSASGSCSWYRTFSAGSLTAGVNSQGFQHGSLLENVFMLPSLWLTDGVARSWVLVSVFSFLLLEMPSHHLPHRPPQHSLVPSGSHVWPHASLRVFSTTGSLYVLLSSDPQMSPGLALCACTLPVPDTCFSVLADVLSHILGEFHPLRFLVFLTLTN